jgi:Plasmid pRiA4b ORF-3-like protein
MPTKKSEIPQEIYQLKVTLLGTTPPIWCRLLVPADMTWEQLHNVLQLAMGWEDCHLHDFRIGPRRFGKPDPNDRLTGLSAIGNERTARLLNVLGKVGAQAVYSYDFGDGWQHGIAMEKVLTPEPGRAYPVCMGGKRHGPPEDCGGVPGYHHLMEVLSDPNHKRHEELREWMGDDFDPEAFSADQVNRRLAPLQRRRAKNKDP